MSDQQQKRQPSIDDVELALSRHMKAITSIFDMMSAQMVTMKKEIDALKSANPEESV
jgi:hypothetical protein